MLGFELLINYCSNYDFAIKCSFTKNTGKFMNSMLYLNMVWRGGREAEGTPLLREYREQSLSRVRIPLSPPIVVVS